MKETTCKKLQEIGAFALAGGCTRKRMKQLVEMIRAARGYRWVGLYKIVKDEFVIVAETGNEPPTYARFPITQGCAARHWIRASRSSSGMCTKTRDICPRFTRRAQKLLFR